MTAFASILATTLRSWLPRSKMSDATVVDVLVICDQKLACAVAGIAAIPMPMRTATTMMRGRWRISVLDPRGAGSHDLTAVGTKCPGRRDDHYRNRCRTQDDDTVVAERAGGAFAAGRTKGFKHGTAALASGDLVAAG